MPKGCTPRAACGGGCQDAERHAEAMQWMLYWNALTPEEQAAEREAISRHTSARPADVCRETEV